MDEILSNFAAGRSLISKWHQSAFFFLISVAPIKIMVFDIIDSTHHIYIDDLGRNLHSTMEAMKSFLYHHSVSYAQGIKITDTSPGS